MTISSLCEAKAEEACIADVTEVSVAAVSTSILGRSAWPVVFDFLVALSSLLSVLSSDQPHFLLCVLASPARFPAF